MSAGPPNQSSAAEPLTELPLKGYYGGKPKRISIEYDDLSSRNIGNADGSVDRIVETLKARAHPSPDSLLVNIVKVLGRDDLHDSQKLLAIGSLIRQVADRKHTSPDRDGLIEKLDALRQPFAVHSSFELLNIGESQVLEKCKEVVRQHLTDHIREATKMVKPGEISLHEIIRKHDLMAPLVRALEALPQAHIRMPDKDVSGSVSRESAWYANMEDVIPLVRDYCIPQSSEPVMVDIETGATAIMQTFCDRWKESLADGITWSYINGSSVWEDEAKACATAWGLKWK